MKKAWAVVCLLLLILVIIITINFKNIEKEKKEIAKYNLTYEDYNTNNLNGLDITTVINKATNNNEKNNISKDKNGNYVSDGMNSIKIYVTMNINEKTYEMERINEVGMNSFIEYFGNVQFQCTDIKYHEKTGRVSELTFRSQD